MDRRQPGAEQGRERGALVEDLLLQTDRLALLAQPRRHELHIAEFVEQAGTQGTTSAGRQFLCLGKAGAGGVALALQQAEVGEQRPYAALGSGEAGCILGAKLLTGGPLDRDLAAVAVE